MKKLVAPISPPRGGRWWVYFIQAGDLPFIKIGKAASIAERMAGLQIGCPLELVLRFYTCESAQKGATEAAFHYLFREHHARGEWFRLAPPIERFLEMEGEVVLRKAATVERRRLRRA